MTNQKLSFSPRLIAQMLLFIVIVPLLPLLISWHWNWWEAWVFAAISIPGFAVSRALAARRHPDLIVERSKILQHEDAKPWDKTLAPLVGLGGGLIPLVAGLDALLDWSPAFNFLLKILALLIFIAGYFLGAYALIEKPLFLRYGAHSNRSRTSGYIERPYRWMRHPGYAGALLSYLVAPVLLDTYWAFLPAAVLTRCAHHPHAVGR